jgi:hypothetical protein
MGAKFDTKIRNYVFSRQASRLSLPAGVEFVNEPLQSLLLCEIQLVNSRPLLFEPDSHHEHQKEQQ